ncbi:MAG: GNAT family N-acetyltransferase [Candidatus Roizmanbacteria bacterium]|nr:GNAT family N-acetyltransferase [Candidatus Roizmanbacteria bacterium]
MKLEIKSQIPTAEDIAQVVTDTKNFPFLTYIGPRTWQSFDRWYTAYVDNTFAGVVAINRFGRWAKLGPLVVLSKFHGKGVATSLIKKAVATEKGNIYLASANPTVWKIARNVGMVKKYNCLNLPLSIQFIYLQLSLNVLRCGEFIQFLKELLRKQKIADVHAFKHFLSRGSLL